MLSLPPPAGEYQATQSELCTLIVRIRANQAFYGRDKHDSVHPNGISTALDLMLVGEDI